MGVSSRLCDIKSKDENAIKDWVEKLTSNPSKLQAHSVYLGDHWTRTIELRERDVQVNIVSAGYGFIHAETIICKYDATFNHNSDNSISAIGLSSKPYEANQKWWKLVNSKINGNEQPIERYFLDNINDVFVIALPPTYLRVILPEILSLYRNGHLNSSNSVVLSTKQKVHTDLEDLFFLVKEQYGSIVGGGHASLNIRTAAYVIEYIKRGRDFQTQVRKAYSILNTKTTSRVIEKRNKLTNQKIQNFIKQYIEQKGNTRISPSSALKELRKNGMACEQKRFTKLYNLILNGVTN